MALFFLGLRILFALALYAFVGWAMYALWQHMEREVVFYKQERVPELALSYQIGDQWHKKVYNQPQLIIGRDPSCDLSVDDRTVSFQHARLSFHHAQWWVEDLNSRNGTYLNQEKIQQAMALVHGDELQCGRLSILVQIGEGSLEQPITDEGGTP